MCNMNLPMLWAQLWDRPLILFAKIFSVIQCSREETKLSHTLKKFYNWVANDRHPFLFQQNITCLRCKNYIRWMNRIFVSLLSLLYSAQSITSSEIIISSNDRISLPLPAYRKTSLKYGWKNRNRTSVEKIFELHK